MKSRLSVIALLLLGMFAALPALADTVYDNGPINGNVDAWTINSGFVVSDTFTMSDGAYSINGLAFAAWLFPGDTNLSVEVSITSDEFGGTSYFDQIVNFEQDTCFTNGYGFNVCTESALFGEVDLPLGTYWLNLQNASVSSGDPVYWDENSGPSLASESSVGTIPSEAFTLFGTTTSTTCGCCGNGASPSCIPEPGTLTLFGSGALTMFGSGVLGFVGVLWRKLF